MNNWLRKLFLPEPMKVSIRGVLYDVDKRQYKRGITEAVIHKDDSGFVEWITKQGSGEVSCIVSMKKKLLESSADYYEHKGHPDHVIVQVCSESEAFELIDGC